MPPSEPPSWDDKTDPASLAGMSKALKANTEAVSKAVDWSMKTHGLVIADGKRVDRIERIVERVYQDRFVAPRAMMLVSLALSLAALACELIRK